MAQTINYHGQHIHIDTRGRITVQISLADGTNGTQDAPSVRRAREIIRTAVSAMAKPNARYAWIKLDSQERFNLRRAWRVNAWRLVDADGRDMVQPWSDTRGNALRVADALGYVILGDWAPSPAYPGRAAGAGPA